MVSSGISAGINPIRPVEGMTGSNSKSATVEFGEFMAQTMSTNVDAGKEFASAFQINGQNAVKNTTTDAADRIPKKEEAVVADKAEVKEQAKQETKVKDADAAIRDKIKEKFGVTDEDIDEALETLGFTMADLLNASNLTDFVVELTGMESTVDLLVSGEMSANVDELLGFIQETFTQLSEEYGVSVEEMTDIFNELTSEINAEILEKDVPVEKLTDLPVAEAVEINQKQDEVSSVADSAEEMEEPEELTTKTTDESAINAENAEGTTEIKLTETKSEGETKQTFDNNQNPDAMQQGIINNLSEAITEAFNVNGVNSNIDPVQLINQIVENAKILLNQEVTSMEMMLNPESLGKINLNISVREGVVTATIVAQNEVVKEAIESQIIMLKDNLNNQGLKVEAVEVTVESHAFEAETYQGEGNAFNSQQEEAKKKNNRPLRIDSLEDLQIEDLTDEERIVLDMMVENGNQINFKA